MGLELQDVLMKTWDFRQNFEHLSESLLLIELGKLHRNNALITVRLQMLCEK